MKLISNNLLLKKIENNETASGLYIPINNQNHIEAEVVDFDERLTQFTKGDIVYINKNQTIHNISVEEEKLIIVNVSAVILIK